MRKLNPVERAVARQKWSSGVLMAHITALTGNDWHKVVDRVGELTFIVGYAADLDGLENTDLKIVHGAARTLCDIVVAKGLTDLQRGSLDAGMRAVQRITPLLKDESLIAASCHVSMLVKTQGVYWEDFEKWL